MEMKEDGYTYMTPREEMELMRLVVEDLEAKGEGKELSNRLLDAIGRIQGATGLEFKEIVQIAERNGLW